MAFQPIVDVVAENIHSYEALVRGEKGESAYQVLQKVTKKNRYSFDQRCRLAAIETISNLDRQSKVSINFMPEAIYDPRACLSQSVKKAAECNYPISNINFELTEQEPITDRRFLVDIFMAYRAHGFSTALDDFGEGYSGLNLLSQFQPDIIKLDMQLVRNIDTDAAKQAIFKGVKTICDLMGITLLAEGVETADEYDFMKKNDVRLMQGYYIAKPEIEALPKVSW